MSYTRIDLLVNADTRQLIKATTQQVAPVASSRPRFIYADTAVLAVHFVDSAGDDYALAAGDTFDFGLDKDFTRTFDTGAAAAGYSGTPATIQLTGLSLASTMPSTGHIRLVNGAGNYDRIAYTAFDGTDTFTTGVALTYTYLLGDTVYVEDELMAYSDDDEVDIAGDWADIARASGKISIRVNCLTDAFLSKITAGASSSDGSMQTWFQIRRVPSGETEYSTICQDYCYSYESVIGSSTGAPGETSTDYLTQTQGDARYLKLYSAYSEIGGALADGDKFNMADASDGDTVKYSLLSRFYTYIVTKLDAAVIDAAVKLNTVAKSGDYTVTDTDKVYTILMTAGAADKTVTLPTAADNTGRILNIKLVDQAAGNCIIDGEGAETIDGNATVTITTQYTSIKVQCDGTEWWII